MRKTICEDRRAERILAGSYLLLHFFGLFLWFARFFIEYGLTYLAALFLGGLATWFVIFNYLVDGCSRIARGAPWAGSVTGGEACGYPCSEKEGFTHPSLLRAPCFWGAKNVETAR